jgi:hypothetical protein
MCICNGKMEGLAISPKEHSEKAGRYHENGYPQSFLQVKYPVFSEGCLQLSYAPIP